ncbi:DUF333 domain-containing protein [Acerihabitans sp.]|uniref:putative hemolysin n=1 Tax=Acerihabitans sp. TaxID=2811394 RepID=UPI002ED94661
MTFSPWLMATSALFLVACAGSNNEEPEQIAQQANTASLPQRVEVPNTPRCMNAGGTMTLARQLDGTTVGMCQLANGKRF